MFPQAADPRHASMQNLRDQTAAAFALKTKSVPAINRLFGDASEGASDDMRSRIRRGIIIAEVLAKPVSLRPPE